MSSRRCPTRTSRRPWSLAESELPSYTAYPIHFFSYPWQSQSRPESTSRRRIEFNRPSVQLSEIPHDRESQPRSRRRFIGTHTTRQDGVAHRRLESLPIVVDRENYVTVVDCR